MIATRSRPVFAGLLPHAPVLIPGLGGAAQPRCRDSQDACREFARRLAASAPDRVVLLSPHAQRSVTALGLYDGALLRGDLGAFGAADVMVAVPGDPVFAAVLARAGRAARVEVVRLRTRVLDHGAVVPLWFLAEAGFRGPTTVLAPPLACGPEQIAAIGRALAAAVAAVGGRTALVASGDMTHRADVGAPAGYDRRAIEFDRRMIDCVRRGELPAIGTIDPELRELAAEDAADTTALVAAAIGDRVHGNEVLGYGHPFGVGYLIAVLHDEGAEAS